MDHPRRSALPSSEPPIIRRIEFPRQLSFEQTAVSPSREEPEDLLTLPSDADRRSRRRKAYVASTAVAAAIAVLAAGAFHGSGTDTTATPALGTTIPLAGTEATIEPGGNVSSTPEPVALQLEALRGEDLGATEPAPIITFGPDDAVVLRFEAPPVEERTMLTYELADQNGAMIQQASVYINPGDRLRIIRVPSSLLYVGDFTARILAGDDVLARSSFSRS